MDFKDTIKQISDRIVKLKDNLQTGVATKRGRNTPSMGFRIFTNTPMT